MTQKVKKKSGNGNGAEHTHEKEPTLKIIKPRTKNQSEYLASIQQNQIVLCTGPAGSGKTLLAAYAAAKEVVLPSWQENPGLSVLEGGLAGANVLVTSRGSAKEIHSVRTQFSLKEVESELIATAKQIQECIKSNSFSPCAVEKNCQFCEDFIYNK